MWYEKNFQWHYDYVRLAVDTGFSFETRKHKVVDKTKISLIDVDRVIRERDIATVETCIPTILQFVVEIEQTELLDVSFVKTFQLSQLSLHYLLYCKKYLDNTVVLLKEQLAKMKRENAELKEFAEDLKKHIATLMKEIREQSGFKCQDCDKVFSAQDYLTSHRKRRHSVPGSEVPVAETDKLQMEIKELKGRLNSAEKLLRQEQNEPKFDSNIGRENESKIRDLHQKFESLKVQVESELKLIQKDRDFEEICQKWFQNFELNKSKVADDPAEKRENTTQTDVNEVVVKVEEVVKESNVDAQRDDLEIKVTSSLMKIENQMQSFWNKLNEIETINKNVLNSDEKLPPVVKPRTKYTSKNPPPPEPTRPMQEPIETNPSPIIMKQVSRRKANIQEPQIVKVAERIGELINYDDVSSHQSESSESIKIEPKSPVKRVQMAERKRRPASFKKPVVEDTILNAFRDEIESLLKMRLQDLGVSPDWTGLPPRSFQKVIEIVNHQASLAKKNYPNFDEISVQIENTVSKVLNEGKMNRISDNKGMFATKTKTRNRKEIRALSGKSVTMASEIKNKQMYETDSESEPSRAPESKPAFSAVIQQLKADSVAKRRQSDAVSDFLAINDKESDKKIDDPTKGVLKSYPSAGSLSKKRVLFNLQSQNDKEKIGNVGRDGGSTTSVASSVFDQTPRKNQKESADIEHLSDFDSSEL